MSDFETWWQQEGQEFLYALNTTTDDDIKLVAEIAWKNGAYCAEQAEQEPVAVVEITYGREPECYVTGNIDDFPDGVFKLYAAPVQQAEQEPVAERFEKMHANGDVWITTIAAAAIARNAAPVRTKDLTDDEIMDLVRDECVDMHWPSTPLFIARAVIAADREKNK